MIGKHIFYLSPSFFGYDQEIKKTLENEFGAYVDFFDDRPSNHFLTKVLIRLRLKLFLKYQINSYYKKIFDDIREKVYDYIFIVSPETLGEKELRIIRRLQPQAKFILYMWDSFVNKNSFEIIYLFDRVLSFDSEDVKKYNLHFCPLFYCNQYKNISATNEILYDICSIATAHSDRYKLVMKIKKLMEDSGLKIFSFLYLPSKLMYWIRKIFFKSYGFGDLSSFSFSPMTADDIALKMSHAKAVLDINHSRQNGLTMRTFEVFGMQKKLVTTNVNIKYYDFYNEANILIIDRENPCIDMAFLKSPYMIPNRELYEKYSLSNWLKYVFDCS